MSPEPSYILTRDDRNSGSDQPRVNLERVRGRSRRFIVSVLTSEIAAINQDLCSLRNDWWDYHNGAYNFNFQMLFIDSLVFIYNYQRFNISNEI